MNTKQKMVSKVLLEPSGTSSGDRSSFGTRDEPQRNSCDKRNDNEKKEEVIIDLSKPVTGNAKILELSQALEI
jgi:hypothetical protein